MPILKDQMNQGKKKLLFTILKTEKIFQIMKIIKIQYY